MVNIAPNNIDQRCYFIIRRNIFPRRLSLRTATNRLLISLLVADFLLLLVCYLTVAQNIKGVPMFGTNGKKIGRAVIT